MFFCDMLQFVNEALFQVICIVQGGPKTDTQFFGDNFGN